ncbi:uncharacterized protein [Antedon mediterranea]|uniref:uncharacterized protein n=1 Tax=Antedon mediterranea TaxID=105859 RepID=UPI003AF8B3E3
MKTGIQSSAKLIVKKVPEPRCMDLPKTVTLTERIALSCMIGAGNHDTRLTWYKSDSEGFLNSATFPQSTEKSYLNITILASKNVNNYFTCIASSLEGGQAESCSTNLMNIVKEETSSLPVVVFTQNTMPIISGSEGCFQCIVTCDTCAGLIEFTWEYNGSSSFLHSQRSNTRCFASISLIDNGKVLKCRATFDSKSGSGKIVIKVVDGLTMPMTQPVATQTYSTHSTNQHQDKVQKTLKTTSFYIPIAIVVVIIIITICGFFGFHLYCKYKQTPNITEDKLNMKNITTSGSLNNQQQYTLDVFPMYAKVQKVNNLSEKQNIDQNKLPEHEEIPMYAPVEIHKQTSDKRVNTTVAIKTETSENQVNHWKSPSGDIYACIQKNKASTLPASIKTKNAPDTKPKKLKKNVNHSRESAIDGNDDISKNIPENESNKKLQENISDKPRDKDHPHVKKNIQKS